MKPISKDAHMQAARVCREQVLFMEWLEEWAAEETSKLIVVGDAYKIQQGRAQVLTSLVKLLRDAPSKAASS